jgi:hypothetical protein
MEWDEQMVLAWWKNQQHNKEKSRQSFMASWKKKHPS